MLSAQNHTKNAKVNYSPFGTALYGRNWSSSKYRYGFNSQEKDDEVSGEGNSYTAEFWQYSSRLAVRWNLDPKPNPAISPYATFAGNPIFYSDPKGDTVRGFHTIIQATLGIYAFSLINNQGSTMQRAVASFYTNSQQAKHGTTNVPRSNQNIALNFVASNGANPQWNAVIPGPPLQPSGSVVQPRYNGTALAGFDVALNAPATPADGTTVVNFVRALTIVQNITNMYNQYLSDGNLVTMQNNINALQTAVTAGTYNFQNDPIYNSFMDDFLNGVTDVSDPGVPTGIRPTSSNLFLDPNIQALNTNYQAITGQSLLIPQTSDFRAGTVGDQQYTNGRARIGDSEIQESRGARMSTKNDARAAR